MTHGWSLSRRCALTALFAAFSLGAQEKTKWDEHFQQGVQAFAAARYTQAVEFLTTAIQDAEAFPALDLRRADTAQLLGMSYQFQGQFNRAETLFQQAKDIQESNGEEGRKLLGVTLDAIAQLRLEQKQ